MTDFHLPILTGAFFLAESIHLKRLKADYTGNLLSETQTELFYGLPDGAFVYVFNYGAVVFANMNDLVMSQNIQLFSNYCERILPEKIREDYAIECTPDAPLRFHFNTLSVPTLNNDVIKIVMFNMAASVTLDYYDRHSEQLLAEVRDVSEHLEKSGSVKMNRKNMLRFIGKTLNSKSRIVQNLYLFDSPELIWEDEYLDRIHRGLVKSFDLSSRFKEIEYTFKIVEENLSIFREVYHQRESNILEWIIIILITIEVLDLIISKLL